MNKMKYVKYGFYFLAFSLICHLSFGRFIKESEDFLPLTFLFSNENKTNLNVDFFKSELTKKFYDGERPEQLQINGKTFKLEYTFNEKLEEYITELLKSYRPDFASVVVLDNLTGNVLAAVDFGRKLDNYKQTAENYVPLYISGQNPAASVFKIITSVELLKKDDVDIESKFSYWGRPHTLYKYQLNSESKYHYKKWIKNISLQTAFANSNNVVFGRAAIDYIDPGAFWNTAMKFGFGEKLLEEIDIRPSTLVFPKSNYQLAELASGFNKSTLISPLHAALMVSVMANNGVKVYPKILYKVSENGKTVWAPTHKVKRVLSKEVADSTMSLMRSTVVNGTAKKYLKKLVLNNENWLEIGGKTGSITGGEPQGKRDWFVMYTKLKDKAGRSGLSLGIMIINQKKWYVKSTFVGKKIVEYWYKNR